jgi:dihydroorotate dehydrogenase
VFYKFIRFFLFLLPPEFAHVVTTKLIKLFFKVPGVFSFCLKRRPYNPVSVCGLSFHNPLGLAGGFDKNGELIDEMLALGFGFVEVGTVTPKAQQGNAKPRLFRLMKNRALINRMGFNNKGVDYLVSKLSARREHGIVGVNVGKNKATPLERAIDDYRYCIERVYPYADYVTINISSPNTPGLRQLQTEAFLDGLLAQLSDQRQALSKTHQKVHPYFIKVTVDLASEQVEPLVRLAQKYHFDGVISSNTTVDQSGLVTGDAAIGQLGGLSGAPLLSAAHKQMKQLSQLSAGTLELIGVGGVMGLTDANQRCQSGASLIQVYTGFIYNGVGWMRDLAKNMGKK